MTAVDEDFRQVQDLWSEWLISEKFCDAAILGPQNI